MSHSANYYNGLIYVFGVRLMQGSKDQKKGDLWRFSLSNRTWSRLKQRGQTPIPRDFHSSVLCSGYIVLFGVLSTQGSSGPVKLNDVFVYRLADFVPGYQFPLRNLYEFIDNEGIISDLRVISLENRVFFSQKCIISVSAPLLALDIVSETTLRSQFTRYTVTIQGSSAVVRELLRFVYTGSIGNGVNSRILMEAVTVGWRYGLVSMVNQAVHALEVGMNVQNSIEIIQFFRQIHLENELKSRISRINSGNEALAKRFMKVAQKISAMGVVGKAIGYLKGQWERLQASGETAGIPGDVAIEVNTRSDPSIPRPSVSVTSESVPGRTEIMSSLYNDDSSKDFSLLFPASPPLSAHSAVLFSSSLYFRSLISSGLQEAQTLQVTLSDDLNRDDIALIIRYIYEGPSVFSGFSLPKMLEIVRMADYYRIINNDAK